MRKKQEYKYTVSGTTLILTEERKWDGSYVKIICKYEISSESVITPKEAILYIDGNLSEKDSKNETENIKRATYLKVEKAPTKRYDEYYKDGKQITSQDLMANKKAAPKQTRSCYSHCMVWEKCWLWSYSSVRTDYCNFCSQDIIV